MRTGEIPLKDVPYMQRGGSWTNSDLTGKGKGWMNTGFGMYAFNDGKAKTAKANKFDKMYNPGSKRDGFSVGIFGEAGALDWTGRGARSGGGAEAGSRDGVSARAQKNGISADMQMWRDAGAVDPKKLQANRGAAAAPKIDVAKAKQPSRTALGPRELPRRRRLWLSVSSIMPREGRVDGVGRTRHRHRRATRVDLRARVAPASRLTAPESSSFSSSSSTKYPPCSRRNPHYFHLDRDRV